jgi:hypothetical protein
MCATLQTSHAKRSVRRNRPKIGHRLAAADRGEIAEIVIAERSRQGFSNQPRGDDAGDIGALLLSDGRHARQRPVRADNLGWHCQENGLLDRRGSA